MARTILPRLSENTKPIRQHPKYPRYQVTPDGDVYGLYGKQCGHTMGTVGYPYVPMTNDYKNPAYKNMTVHRIVMDAWCGESKLFIDHLNGNRADPRIQNLEYVTNATNLKRSALLRRNLLGKEYNEELKLWSAYIYVNGNKVNLGLYETEQDAVSAYMGALRIFEQHLGIAQIRR